MKKLKEYSIRTLTILGVLLIVSCTADDSLNKDISTEETETFALNLVTLTDEQRSAIESQSMYIDSNQVPEVSTVFRDKIYEGITVGDIFISYEELDKWVRANNSNSKLFIRESRVETNGRRTLNIGIVTSGNASVSPTIKNGAITAVQRYKSLNTVELDFTFTTGALGDLSDPDIIIFRDDNNSFIGDTGFTAIAQFPSNGNPGGLIAINRDFADNPDFPQSVWTVLMQHEIGHAIGLRHSDFKNQISCGPFQDEGILASEQIPGSNATGKNRNSLMRACNIAFSISDFFPSDRTSIRRAYNGVDF